MKSWPDRLVSLLAYAALTVFAVICLYPLLLTLMASLSDNKQIVLHGLSLIPAKISFDTYSYLWDTASRNIINAYFVTIAVTVAGTAFSMAITSMMAYTLSLKHIKYRNILSMFAYFTVVFSAGMVPWYMVCVKVLHIENTIFALFLPYAVNVWFLFLMRNYFQSIPDALFESAKIDGANEFYIFTAIGLPLAKTAVLTVSMFYALQYRNDWWLAIMLITRKELFPLQYYLFSTLENVQALSRNAKPSSVPLPTETVKMGVTIITIGPIILLYPLVQKYFVKGIMVGAVKG